MDILENLPQGFQRSFGDMYVFVYIGTQRLVLGHPKLGDTCWICKLWGQVEN